MIASADSRNRHARPNSAMHWLRCAVSAALIGALLAPAPAAAQMDARAKEPAKQSKAAEPAAKISLSRAFKGRLPITELSEEEATLHALNRLAFGPRPGDIERIRAMGLEKWIEQQLNPEKIDDGALAKRLEKYPVLAMSTSQLYEKFPNPAIAAARMGITPEEYRKRQQEQYREEFREKMRQQRQSGEDMQPGARQRLGQAPDRDVRRMEMLEETNSPRRMLGELSAAKLTRAVYSERQLEAVMEDFWFNHFNVFAQKGPTLYMLPEYEREAIRPHAMGKFSDMLNATAKSPAMLFYLDNWQSADPKGAEKMQAELNQRRNRFLQMFGGQPPRMNGRFQQPRQNPNQPALQGRSPSGQVTPEQMERFRQQQNRMPRGLNENYARELMELHTLGVDGGYTQQDIIEVAKAFTGWTLRAPRRNAEFQFEPRIHDDSDKMILGRKFTASGMKQGEEILSVLAAHPNTAKFVSTKLARRFVNDTPPPALVERMAISFAESKGDVRSVLHTMIYSREFWSRENYRSKIKKPFDLIASAARALNADLDSPFALAIWAGRIGEPLYLCQPPTGYADKAETWVNTGALLNRLNFTMELAGGRMRGARVDSAALLGANESSAPEKVLAQSIKLFLAGQVSEQTRATLEKQLTDPQVLRATEDDRRINVDAGLIAGLVLGSPEFQRR